MCSFLGHVGSYRSFIKNLSKIALHLSRLLHKKTIFVFDDHCKESFYQLKQKLTFPPIIQPQRWEDLPFEFMCDASNYAFGAVLSQRVDKISHVIAYTQGKKKPKTAHDKINRKKEFTIGEKVLLYN